jgi:transcriptional regulator with PAS, ATPase and Fis domain
VCVRSYIVIAVIGRSRQFLEVRVARRAWRATNGAHFSTKVADGGFLSNIPARVLSVSADQNITFVLAGPIMPRPICTFAKECFDSGMLTTRETRTFLGMAAVIASEPMHRLMQLVERVACTSASVLIQGESGSGKEVVARAIHYYSLRSNNPWVDVSCAALPEQLIESELFGYDKGAFSGAGTSKPGLFELAHRGTIFLDEIGELEPRMQVKLLRVLDGVPYYRLGGVRKVSVDVRVIAATNQDLDDAIANGRFRNDLFHRLSQISIRVPPLRDRVEDIIPLAEFFLNQQNPAIRLSSGAAEKLRQYSWPGNIRELRNSLMRASLGPLEDDQIRARDLPLRTSNVVRESDGVPTRDLGDMEKRMIYQVLAQTGGHHQKAADLLGISRRTLTRRLKVYGAKVEGEYAQDGV